MTALPDFDTVTERLLALVEEQDDPSGCQVVFYPATKGGTYIAQIAFRGTVERGEDVRNFLAKVMLILREGVRHLVVRTSDMGHEKDFETRELVTIGYLRVWALDEVGDVESPVLLPEMVGMAALH